MATNPQSQDQESHATAEKLAGKAQQCRRLAAGISDKQASEVLRSMADNYDQTAARLSDGQ